MIRIVASLILIHIFFTIVTASIYRNRRIAEGRRALKGEAPFVASLQYIENNTIKHFCTGVYIGQGLILTASHCLQDVKQNICKIFVQIGEIQISMNNNRSRYKVLKHCKKKHDIYTYYNDIGILKLNMNKSDQLYNASFVTIPKNYRIKIDSCTIYGFGSTKYGGPFSDYLLAGNILPISRTKCYSILGSVITPEYHMGMFCASGVNGVDACGGDSGGGMVCYSKNSSDIYLIGIVSFGVGCGSNAGVYTSPIHHYKWIEENIQNLL